jgi:hypothetical protein
MNEYESDRITMTAVQFSKTFPDAILYTTFSTCNGLGWNLELHSELATDQLSHSISNPRNYSTQINHITSHHKLYCFAAQLLTLF